MDSSEIETPGEGSGGVAPDPAGKQACGDGDDDDDDGLVDMMDPGCASRADPDEADPFSGAADCSDGVDNDGDGLVDAEEAGCFGPAPTGLETPVNTDCNDGIDNDGDGVVDLRLRMLRAI